MKPLELPTDDTKPSLSELKALFKEKRYGDALAILEDTVKKAPASDAAWTYRGAAFHNLKQYQKAIQSYNQALKINPQNKAARLNRIRATRCYLGRIWGMAIWIGIIILILVAIIRAIVPIIP
jgi:tetratricopeptide (TPR) repeat protein